MSVAIARGKIHLRKGVLSAKSGIHKAAALENLRPIQCGYETHARDHVADGHVRPNLSVMFRPDHVVATSALGRDLFVHFSGITGDGYRSLAEGTKVSYDEEQGDKGPKAVNVAKL